MTDLRTTMATLSNFCLSNEIEEYTDLTVEEVRAGCQLIAAAPELLEALITAQAVIGDLVREGGASIDEIEAYSAVKNAIAKAEGRT